LTESVKKLWSLYLDENQVSDLKPLAEQARGLAPEVTTWVWVPRESNTEGGVFPAIFGTVMMVMIMSVAVMVMVMTVIVIV
jgi:ABC-type phosphate transport system permease subunit